jgi:tetratricopeptide (TPR) repeat protein
MVIQNEEGLASLVESDCWGDVVTLGKTLLQRQTHGSDGGDRLQLIIAGAELRQGNVDKCAVMLAGLPSPDPSCTSRRQLMTAAAPDLLRSDVLCARGKVEAAIAKLHTLLRLMHASSEDAEGVPDTEWDACERAVVLKLVNCCVQGATPDLSLVLELLENAVSRAGPGERSELLGYMGRVHLQCGDLAGASRVFQRAKESMGQPINSEGAEQADIIHRSMLLIAGCQYTEAQELVARAPGCLLAVNNLSVCALYNNDVKSAILHLENLIRQDPLQHTRGAVLVNLRTLYELSAQPQEKKRLVDDLVARYAPMHFV